MRERTHITGRYVLVNEPFLRQQAQRADPGKVFYAAILVHNTYEGYLADVGQKTVEIPGKKVNPISGRMEILYCRRNGWIEDAA
jgi:hypothetical protein